MNLFLLTQFFFRKKYITFFSLFLVNLVLAGYLQTYISTGGNFNYESLTQFSLPVCSVVSVKQCPGDYSPVLYPGKGIQTT